METIGPDKFSLADRAYLAEVSTTCSRPVRLISRVVDQSVTFALPIGDR
jgi:hypothetical protein